MKFALISLRPEFFEAIETGKKNVEYRRSFSAGFAGPVFVYVSRPFSRVLARFEAPAAYLFSLDKRPSKAALEWFVSQPDAVKDTIADAVYAGKIFAVPVTNFRRIETPLTLDEFAAKYGVAKRLRMPWNPAELIEGNFGG